MKRSTQQAFEVDFVKPHLDLDKDGGRLIELEMSLPLDDNHRGRIPKPVESAWQYLRAGEARRIDVVGIPLQLVTVHEIEPGKGAGLEVRLTAAQVTHAAVALIEARGTGEAVDTVRFTFRLRVALTKELASFALWHYGLTVWLQLQDSQRGLPLAQPKGGERAQ